VLIKRRSGRISRESTRKTRIIPRFDSCTFAKFAADLFFINGKIANSSTLEEQFAAKRKLRSI